MLQKDDISNEVSWESSKHAIGTRERNASCRFQSQWKKKKSLSNIASPVIIVEVGVSVSCRL